MLLARLHLAAAALLAGVATACEDDEWYIPPQFRGLTLQTRRVHSKRLQPSARPTLPQQITDLQ